MDQDKRAIQTVYANLKSCKVEEEVEVYRNDAMRALKALVKRDIQFDYIFLDPPYAKQELIKMLEFFQENNLLAKSGVILCEHDRSVKLPDDVLNLQRRKYEEYGIIAISIYEFTDENQLDEEEIL